MYWQKRGSKYNAKRTTYNGHTYHSAIGAIAGLLAGHHFGKRQAQQRPTRDKTAIG